MIPLCFTVAFWAFALLASVFYAWKCFDAFGVRTTEKPWGWWVHQVWFNLSGSLVGWVATWFVVRKVWHCFAAGSCASPRWSDAALMVVALVGITGHLPYATAGALEGIRELAKKVTGLGE